MNQGYDVSPILRLHYDIEPMNVTPQKGGWAALAFRVTCAHGRSYFLKMYEKSRASTAKWTALIDVYMPVMEWLRHHSRLQGSVPVPVLTNNGRFQCEDEHGVYLLYDYIDGETIGERALSEMQFSRLSELIAELHAYGEEIPVPTEALKETFDVPYLQPLRSVIDTELYELPADVQAVLQSYTPQLQEALLTVEQLSAVLKERTLPMVLCHTDIHNWNLMQSGDELLWIDWEGLRLAPPEADLMFMAEMPYYDRFLCEYRKRHAGYEVNREALHFYQGRRKLEDIWEFIEQLLQDKQDEQDRADTLHSLQKELKSLDA
ncbi:hypothetical protein PAESOLCIP111_00981 [Paenibacillus solanacearum]|uniref:Aminoglycoside phosphotransferase domain-containing protein n=1 Tax=Paenibacillus solanacearum TaxID=2048548 RepID=A0A916JX83_9BACL|nr:aminoglycoside phosphotransferase family protein [Paenibacillus solanacearum]CAG7607651.1 hypothetical protein PAESOLCIP111_00981 [Paenibacillus solanacearum]